MGEGLDVTVLENEALKLACSLNDDIDHGSNQLVRRNHQAGERHPKRGLDPAQTRFQLEIDVRLARLRTEESSPFATRLKITNTAASTKDAATGPIL
jgi:hypothetical protein